MNKKVYLLTKQLVLGPTATPTMIVGVFDSFDKASSISDKWVQIGEVQWGYRHNNIHYIITEHAVQ